MTDANLPSESLVGGSVRWREWWRAPADRPAGARGPRGPLAAVLSFGALAELSYATYADDPAWTTVVLALGGVAVLAAAVLFWAARRPAALAFALGLVAVGAATWYVASDAQGRAQREADKWLGSTFDYPRGGPRLTKERAESVPKGLTRAQLKAAVGTPASRGTQNVAGERPMRCLAYRVAKQDRAPQRWLFAFCFRDGRYEALREW